MPSWLGYAILSIFFLVTGFLGIWAIREGGSFAFLTPSSRVEWWLRQHGELGCRPVARNLSGTA